MSAPGVKALLTVRELTIKGLLPQWSSDRRNIILSGHSFPRKTLTPYRMKGKAQDFYPLDALVFLLEDAAKEKTTVFAYMQDAAKQGVVAVPVLQKKELLAYLKGEVDTTPSIDVQGLEAAGGAAASAADTTEEKETEEER